MISMAVPPHVSDHLVEEFDYYQDSQLKVDPVNRYNELGRRHPEGVFYSVCNGGFWVICLFFEHIWIRTHTHTAYTGPSYTHYNISW